MNLIQRSDPFRLGDIVYLVKDRGGCSMAETKVDSITGAFRQYILRGDFGPMGKLPSLRVLAEQFDTTRETMKKVIQRLLADGLIVSHGTAGMFLSSHTRMPGITARFDLYLKDQGLTPVEADIDEPSVIPAPIEVARVFDSEVGTPVARRYRRQGTTEAHYRLTEHFYAPHLVDQTMVEQMQKDVSFDLLHAIKQKYGKKVKHLHETVIGRLPTSKEQGLLRIARTSPILEVHRTSYADDDEHTPVLFSRILYVARYFELSYDYTVPYWPDMKEGM
jgi:DNA-binding GntR family transcriptional regulator